MNRILCCALACLMASTCLVTDSPQADAQCATCASPTVSYYQPTTAYYQPASTVVYRNRWYPGRFVDRLRARRWGYATAPAGTYTAAYAPYTAAYTPYTAAYTPYTTSYAYTAAYRPYVTSYAPLVRTSYYTAARPVALSPVVSTCSSCDCDPCGCNPCSCGLSSCDACSSCSSCSSGVSQAIYSDAGTGCASCAASAGTPSYSDQNVGPPTPQPSLKPEEAVPGTSQYETNRPAAESGSDPGPVTEEATSTYFEAPKLFDPRDRTASRAPTVPVRKAVYTAPAKTYSAGYAPARDVDADGWYAAE